MDNERNEIIEEIMLQRGYTDINQIPEEIWETELLGWD